MGSYTPPPLLDPTHLSPALSLALFLSLSLSPSLRMLLPLPCARVELFVSQSQLLEGKQEREGRGGAEQGVEEQESRQQIIGQRT